MSQPEVFSVLFVAYPLLAVSANSAGGAEQALLTLEREMAAAGHRTTVAAADGSEVAGLLMPTGTPATSADEFESREREQCDLLLTYLRRHPRQFSLIHDHSGSFFRYARQCPVPVLATLHLPRPFYREEWFRSVPANLYFNCVSRAQANSFAGLPNFLGAVQNGIAIEQFQFTPEKDEYLLWLGRICEEKGPHLAIAAARQAGMPLVLAGQVYPFSYHRQFFGREIRPQLAPGWVEYIDSPSFAQKRSFLRHARALLITSTAEETSSLVAMEALASGTPVVALRRGAMAEIVADGETGFVVDSIEEMPAALARVGRISPAACRARVEKRFTAARMRAGYENLYREVLNRAADRRAA